MANVGTAYLHIMPETKGIKGELTKAMGYSATSAGKTAGVNLVSALKGVIVGAGIAAFFKNAMEQGGKLEQSFGGLETIYGNAAEGMKKLSYEAAQAGISANDYAEQAVSFGASLKQAFGGDTVKAASAANTAILDMADNAAKMGTDMQSIQNAYQGFAKQNYTMLDNLKLGYGGTKTEMERLLKDATKLSGVKYDISNLGDVYEAIHVVQQELGLTGVAAMEGAETFKGSAKAMKASYDNVLANMALGESIKGPLKTLVVNTKNYLVHNMLPMIGNIVSAIPPLLGDGLKAGLKAIPNLVESAKGMLNNLADAIQNNSGEVFNKIVSVAKNIGGYFYNAIVNTDWAGLGKSILNLLSTGITAGREVLGKAIKTIGNNIKEWFKSVNWSEVGHSVIQHIGDGIGSFGRYLFDSLGNIGKKAIKAFENIDWENAGKTAMDYVIKGAETLWGGIKSIAKVAAERFKGIDWKSVGKSVIHFIVAGLKALGSFLWGALKSIGSTAGEKIKNIDWKGVGTAIINFITTGLRSIGSILWNALKSIGTTAESKIKNIDWKGVGLAIINFIAGGLRSIGSVLWNALKSIGDTAVGKIKGINWKGVGTTIVNFITGGLNSIASTLWSGLKSIGDTAAEKIKGIDWKGVGSAIIDKITSGLQSVGSKIWSGLQTIGNTAKEKILGINWSVTGNNLTSAIANGISGNQGVASQAAGRVISAVNNVFSSNVGTAGSAGTQTGNSYASGIGSASWSAGSNASSLVNTASSYLNNTGWAWDSGASLGQNFANGIAYAQSAVSSAAANIAAIASRFLHHSTPDAGPLKDDNVWGAHFVDNFAKGMEAKIPDVRKAALDVAGAATISPDATFGLPYGTRAMNGGDDITINVYASSGMNINQLAEQIQSRLALAQRQKQAAWGMA